MLKEDVMNTVSILKILQNETEKNIYEFPSLRYKTLILKSLLDKLSTPPPKYDDLSEWHEWNLVMSKSIKAILRYFWDDISEDNKMIAKNFFEKFLLLKFEKFYVPSEGGFSYYPYGEHSALDGASAYFFYEHIGALSSKKQTYLWGTPEETIVNLGNIKTSKFEKDNLSLFEKENSINSLRIYTNNPNYEKLTSNVFAVIYPNDPKVLDIMDITPKFKHWVDTTNQTMGNWTSKSTLKDDLQHIEITETSIYKKNDIPYDLIDIALKKNGKLTIIGFDILQVPRWKLTILESNYFE